ncbi:hypothetical protein AX14_009784 [Amanita brunnescens Koide BX004]|nr:hypothetical protein AX14_006183 [Amanita brunnescens Koide BX004]KAF8739414.1 hypothetical protein AX14_009784 [Amanita brunnescens Koide BX004]
MFAWIEQILYMLRASPAALNHMRLGPEDNPNNPLMLQFFTWDALHEDLSWWKHLEAEIVRLSEMGFTQVWIPPPNKAEVPTGRGYDAYDLWDLGEFNQKGTISTRWGTRQDLLEACEAAREVGIDIIIDAVLGHKLGADRTEAISAVPVDPQNRLKEIGPVRTIEGWTAYDFNGREGKYSAMRWNSEHFTGLDLDHRTQSKGVYRLVGQGHKGWSRHVDRELGNYDYLLGADIDHRHPAVEQDLLEWGSWILETTGATGFRLDAIKHIDYRFLLKFLQHTRQQQSGTPKLFAVSEFWSGDLKTILPYIRIFRGTTAFFDVPLHMNFHNASRHRSRYDLRRILKDTIVDSRPNNAVTFVEGQSLESWVGSNFKIQAYALILLRGRGYPCVFYGDLYPNKECYDENTARNLALLIEARKLFAYGPTEDYLVFKNCIGFVRLGSEKHPGCAVLLSNLEDDSGTYIHSLRMKVGKKYAGTIFRSFLTSHGEVTIDSEGWGEFTCFANHVQVWARLD